jgi:hypothetical protein
VDDEVGSRLPSLPASFQPEVARLGSILRGKLDRRDFTAI